MKTRIKLTLKLRIIAMRIKLIKATKCAENREFQIAEVSYPSVNVSDKFLDNNGRSLGVSHLSSNSEIADNSDEYSQF